jgi:putative endonuclease
MTKKRFCNSFYTRYLLPVLFSGYKSSSSCHPEPQAKGLLTMPSQASYFVYIMTNNSGTLYTGVTNNLERRVFEHTNHLIKGFTKKYKITKLVYFEKTSDVITAIEREKQIKGWNREKKITLIESMNPDWQNLSE